MAITELTKRITLQERNRMQRQVDKNEADAENLEAQAAILRASNAQIAVDIAALKKDIPEPTPVEEPTT